MNENRLRVAASLSIAAAASLAMAAQSQAALQLYWKLDGAPVTDASGHGNDGTAGSGVTFSSPSSTGLNSSSPASVANFDGSSAITSNASASTLNIDGNKPKSVSVWVNMASSAWTNKTQAGPFEIGNDDNAQDFSLRVKSAADGGDGGVDHWRAQFWAADADFTVTGSADHWTHFVMIYDPSNSVYNTSVTVFANDQVVATGNPVLNTASSPKNFAVGQWTNGSTPIYMTGQVDDVAVYDSVLTPDNVASLYGGASPTSLPEPASLGLLAGGSVLALLRRRRA